MIKGVALGEEIIVTTKNKVGLLAEISTMLANEGVNIHSVVAYEIEDVAKLMLVTNANIKIIDELRKKKYMSVEEIEVVVVDLENKRGALKVVTTELAKAKIDIKHIYVTSSSVKEGSSKMVLWTSDNEAAMEVLSQYLPGEGKG
ncbi:MAG: ACT domain-containing protein [Candidatus Omnitrophica bacterium]|nr:ACT domain-containing protein [Candidatus Omnitrophota bacterium]